MHTSTPMLPLFLYNLVVKVIDYVLKYAFSGIIDEIVLSNCNPN